MLAHQKNGNGDKSPSRWELKEHGIKLKVLLI